MECLPVTSTVWLRRSQLLESELQVYHLSLVYRRVTCCVVVAKFGTFISIV